MLAVAILLVLSSLVSGQYVRPYSRYNDPRYVQPLDHRYRQPDAARDYRYNTIYDESPKPYSFSYTAPSDVGPGQSSRTETADGSGKVEGSYSLVNEEGHTRVVDYVADHDGFRATVRTDEPGTDNKSPASVIMQSTAPLAYAGPYNAGPYNAGPYRRPYVHPAVQPILNTVEDPVGGAVEEPINDPLARRMYRRPAYNYNRNNYLGSPHRRGYQPNQRYPYTRPY